MIRLLFYDLETSGLDVSLDQVLQFAAIVTDESFNEKARYNWFVKLNSDLWPSPTALSVTRLSPTELNASGEPENRVIRRVHELFNEPDTVSLGYNTLNFDDEFLRFSFFRNLLTPYTHQYASNCRRADLYPLTVLYYLMRPNGLKWPWIDGRVSLRLEHLREENHFEVLGAAHNALADVEATVALARRLKQDAAFWQSAQPYFIKQLDLERTKRWLSKTPNRTAILVDGSFGFVNNFLTLACCLGKHHHYRNQTLWLKLDQAALNESSESSALFHLIVRKKFGETPLVLPNAPKYQPLLTAQQLDLAKQNLAFLAQHPVWREQLAAYWLDHCYPYIPFLDVDASLYQLGFMSDEVTSARSYFLSVPPEKQLTLLDQLDPVSQEQARRLLGRHHPVLLSKRPEHYAAFESYQSSALYHLNYNFHAKPRRSYPQFLSDWQAVHGLLSTQQQEDLRQLAAERARFSAGQHLTQTAGLS